MARPRRGSPKHHPSKVHENLTNSITLNKNGTDEHFIIATLGKDTLLLTQHSSTTSKLEVCLHDIAMVYVFPIAVMQHSSGAFNSSFVFCGTERTFWSWCITSSGGIKARSELQFRNRSMQRNFWLV